MILFAKAQRSAPMSSFDLAPEEVAKVRDAAHRILVESEEFKRLLGDLK